MIKNVFGFKKGMLLGGVNFYSQTNEYLLSIGLTQAQIDAVQYKLTEEKAA